MSISKPRQRAPRPVAKRYAPADAICPGCLGPIRRGDTILRDATLQSWHPSCKRLAVRPHAGPERTRYLWDDATGAICPGCDHPIEPSDPIVHRSAVPWHKSCKPG